MNKKSWSDRIIEKIKDPIVLVGILLFINYLFVMVLFFNTPISKVTSYTNNTYTEYYWNGYYRMWDADLTSVIDSGFLESFPLAGSWLFISALILMLVVTLSQIISPILQPKTTRIEFTAKIIWPHFIGNMLIVAALLVLIQWIEPKRSEETLSQLGPAIKFALVLSAFMILVILILVAFTSQIYSKKQQIMQETENTQ